MNKANGGRYLGTVLRSRSLNNFVLVESEYTAGQSLPWHSHERAFISIGLQGSYVERCGSSTLFCEEGQVILHTAGELHSNRFLENGARSLNIEILPHFADRLRDDGVDTRTRIAISDRQYVHWGLKLHAEASRYDAVSELAIEGLAMEVLASVIRTQFAQTKRRKVNWLDRVNEYLDERYRESFTLKDLAEYAQVHHVHLARSFQKRYDCSVGDYVRRLRVISACRDLANSEMSIAEIASRNGFSDQSHLCRTIKQYTGKSPRQLRGWKSIEQREA